MTLTEFLLARIAEDESAANDARDLQDYMPTGAWDLGRVLAECEAKRRIISRCDLVIRGRKEQMFNAGQETDARDNLRSLALPYADHPDYDESWRP